MADFEVYILCIISDHLSAKYLTRCGQDGTAV